MSLKFKSEKPCDCPVCYEPLSNEHKSLSCGHWVHRECIINSKKECCPLCRQHVELTLEEKHKIHFLKVKSLGLR